MPRQLTGKPRFSFWSPVLSLSSGAMGEVDISRPQRIHFPSTGCAYTHLIGGSLGI